MINDSTLLRRYAANRDEAAFAEVVRRHPHYNHIAWQYAALVVAQDPNKAIQWANTIKDPKIKQGVLQAISQRAPRAKS